MHRNLLWILQKEKLRMHLDDAPGVVKKPGSADLLCKTFSCHNTARTHMDSLPAFDRRTVESKAVLKNIFIPRFNRA